MTTYTFAERKGMVEAFEASKEYLRERHYICTALMRTQTAYFPLAQKLIHDRLDGAGTVFTWLRREGFLQEADYHTLWMANHYEYRLRWIDSIIKELSDGL